MQKEEDPDVTASWAIALHGGADATPGREYGHVEAHMAALLDETAEWLAASESAVDVAQKAVQALEACGHHIAGKGSSPNQDGVWELDAAIMDGSTRSAGAVSALEGFISPIAVARDVMDVTPHVLLAGNGAAKLARERGHDKVSNPFAYYDPAVKDPLPANAAGHGTVGAVVLDTEGRLAAATSTGGLLNKTPGRVGDSPIIGAGTWADRSVAVSCTGHGEYFMRTAAAASVAARVKYGHEDVASAAAAVIDEVGDLGGRGGLIALGADGTLSLPFNSRGMKRASANSSGLREVKIFA
ncbi:MAG: isoaspartyl peptidase/L-asparaginase [Pseudomonadota bacterium]